MKLALVAKLSWVLASALLLSQCLSYFQFAKWAIYWPYGLDYGEGIVWQQALQMFTPSAYGPIDGFPAIVFHYTPLYHVASRFTAMLFGIDLLVAGRTVSIVSTCLACIVLSLIVSTGTKAEASRLSKTFGGVFTGVAVFVLLPIIYWAHLMRVDMLATLLSVTGFWLGLKAYQNPNIIWFAAILFVAAVFTKQTMIAAPTALFGVMLFSKPRLALAGICICVVLGGISLATLSWLTNGAFIQHVFLYNTNRVDWSQLALVWVIVSFHAPFIGVASILTLRRIEEIRGHKIRLTSITPLSTESNRNFFSIVCYFIVCSIMLVLIVKSGSNINYAIEWLFTLLMLVGLGVVASTEFLYTLAQRPKKPDAAIVIGVLIVPLLLVAQSLQVYRVDSPRDYLTLLLPNLTSLSEKVKKSTKPVVSDEMVLLLRSGKNVVWEPAIFAELASHNRWDERHFISMIHAKEFGMFITVGVRGDRLFDSRYNPSIATAIDDAYPVKEKIAGYTVHLPAPDLPMTR
jgi:hypothetical protein